MNDKKNQSKLSVDGFSGAELMTTTLTGNTFSQVDPSIIFCGKDQKEILKLAPNGDIYVNGRLAENDKSVVDGLRRFLKVQGF